MKIIIYHSTYGCDTGCCGHIFEVDGEQVGDFIFDHPGFKEDFKSWAENMVREKFGEKHVKDLDWENCKVIDD